MKSNDKTLILADSKAAIGAVKKAGRTGKARSRHLQEVVNRVAEIKERRGEVRLGWVKSHIGILGDEAADVCAKQAAEGVPLDDYGKGMSGGGGIRQWAKRTKKESVEGGEEAVIGRAMGWRRKAVTNYCRLREGKGIGGWWNAKIEDRTGGGGEMPEMWERGANAGSHCVPV